MIEVVENRYLPDNTLFLQYAQDPLSFRRLTMLEPDNFNYSVERYYYCGLRIPSLRKFIAIENLFDMENKEIRKVILSLKQKEKLQRRLDRSSNIRRRKRFKELQLRKGKI